MVREQTTAMRHGPAWFSTVEAMSYRTVPALPIIGEALSLVRRQGGELLRSALAGDEPLQPHELADRDDHGLYGPASVAWRVHGDSAMVLGGLRALMLQTLHPLAMAGVADHSDYRHDPWGRLHRTGRFIGATTYGNTATAERMIEMVRVIHDRVTGTTPDGRPYEANDPHLLNWVHITEVDSFLVAYERYGVGRLTDAEKDRYVAEMAEVARRLGAEAVPETRAELTASLDSYRPELEYGDQARDCVRFLLFPPVPLLVRGAYGVISAAAIGMLPTWAQLAIGAPVPPGFDPVAIRPAATVLTRTMGWLMGAEREAELDDRMLIE